jgi:hypothetical protein
MPESLILDVVNQDPFKQISMTDAINKIEHQPNHLGRLGIFTLSPIRSAMVALDVKSNNIRLVKTSKRGEPIESRDKRNKAKFKWFSTDRLALKDRINATDLAFLREFGEADRPKELAGELAERQGGEQGSGGLMGDIDATKEFQRLGALRGKLYDTDGDLLYDYFAEMGVAEPSIIGLDVTTLIDGSLRQTIHDNVVRYMKKTKKGATYSKILAICGPGAIDKLQASPEYRETFKNQAEASDLRDGQAEVVKFAGVEWVEYDGTDDDTTVALGDNEVIFIPCGLNNTVFKQVASPGEKFSHIGKKGKDFYSWIKWDRSDDDPEWVDLYVACYLLMLNTRPEMVRRATISKS